MIGCLGGCYGYGWLFVLGGGGVGWGGGGIFGWGFEVMGRCFGFVFWGVCGVGCCRVGFFGLRCLLWYDLFLFCVLCGCCMCGFCCGVGGDC